MRRPFLILAFCLLTTVMSVEAASGRVVKVLPQFLDAKGRHTLSPSLYDRDAYQALLRANPDQRSGMRFAVQWKAGGSRAESLKLRVELRGIVQGELPHQTVLEQSVKPGWLRRWAYLPITGDEYEKLGDVTAWRVTLWEGNRLLSERKSFLW